MPGNSGEQIMLCACLNMHENPTMTHNSNALIKHNKETRTLHCVLVPKNEKVSFQMKVVIYMKHIS